MTAQVFDWKDATFGMLLKKGTWQRRVKAFLGVSISALMCFKGKLYAVIGTLCSHLRLHCEISGAIKTAFCGNGRPAEICGGEKLGS